MCFVFLFWFVNTLLTNASVEPFFFVTQVSWIRKKDGHLLTVDTDTFIGDGRFQVRHPVHSDTWTLHLRGARATDAGVYECQVSSEPKMSLFYQVNVVGQ